MKIAVDVKKVVQEIDLDSGVTSNYLVFILGGAEHVVEASEDQLQQAIYEAKMLKSNGSAPRPSPPLGAVGEIPVGDPFVEEMTQGDVPDAEVMSALYNGGGAVPNSVFEDVSGVTEDDMAEYVAAGASAHGQVDVVSTEVDRAATFEEIMAHHSDKPRADAPSSPTEQRHANIEANRPHAQPKGQRAVIAQLRARARQVPPRGLQPHQVDEAGNPTVPQVNAPAALTGFSGDPNAPAVRVMAAPPGLAGLGEDDGFEQG